MIHLEVISMVFCIILIRMWLFIYMNPAIGCLSVCCFVEEDAFQR